MYLLEMELHRPQTSKHVVMLTVHVKDIDYFFRYKDQPIGLHLFTKNGKDYDVYENYEDFIVRYNKILYEYENRFKQVLSLDPGFTNSLKNNPELIKESLKNARKDWACICLNESLDACIEQLQAESEKYSKSLFSSLRVMYHKIGIDRAVAKLRDSKKENKKND